MMNDLTMAVFSILGFLLIIIGMVVPYLLYRIRQDIEGIKEDVRELREHCSGELEGDQLRWKKGQFKKI